MHRDLLIPRSLLRVEWSRPPHLLTGHLPPITAYMSRSPFTPLPSLKPQNQSTIDLVPPLHCFTPLLLSQSGEVCWIHMSWDHFLWMDRGHQVHTTPHPPPCQQLPSHHPLPQPLVPPPLPLKKTVKKWLHYLELAALPPQRHSLYIQAWAFSSAEDALLPHLCQASNTTEDVTLFPLSSCRKPLTGRQSTRRLWWPVTPMPLIHIMSQKMDNKHVKAQVQKCHVPRKSPHEPIL